MREITGDGTLQLGNAIGGALSEVCTAVIRRERGGGEEGEWERSEGERC